MTPRSKALLWGAGLLCRQALNKAYARFSRAWSPTCAFALMLLALFTLLDTSSALFCALRYGTPPKAETAAPTPEQIAKALSNSSSLTVTASKFADDGSLLLVVKAPAAAPLTPHASGQATEAKQPGHFAPAELDPWNLCGAAVWALALILGLASFLQGAWRTFKTLRAASQGAAAVPFFTSFSSGVFGEGSSFAKISRAGALDSYFNIAGAPANPPCATLRFALVFPLAAVNIFGLCAIGIALVCACVIALIFLFSPIINFSGQAPWIAKAAPWSPLGWAACIFLFAPRAWKAFQSNTPAIAAAAAESASKVCDALLKAGSAKFADEEAQALAAETDDPATPKKNSRAHKSL